MDTNLVELARRWVSKLLPFIRIIAYVSDAVFYKTSFSSLLNAGCEPIGIDRLMYIYMRCKGRLIHVLLPMQYQDMFREVLKKVPKLDDVARERLTDRLPYVAISPHLYRKFLVVYGEEPIYFTKLENFTPYLDEIEINVSLRYRSFDIYVRGVMSIGYTVNEDGSVKKLLVPLSLMGENRQVATSILADLDKKHSIIDRLLEEAYELFVGEVKQLIAVFLY